MTKQNLKLLIKKQMEEAGKEDESTAGEEILSPLRWRTDSACLCPKNTIEWEISGGGIAYETKPYERSLKWDREMGGEIDYC